MVRATLFQSVDETERSVQPSEFIRSSNNPDASQCESLTQAKKNIPALKQVNAQVLQQTLRRLQLAFEGMWKNGRGFPRYKKAGRMRSFMFPRLGVKFDFKDNLRIRIPPDVTGDVLGELV